jgi:CopA family copper-resistance protein
VHVTERGRYAFTRRRFLKGLAGVGTLATFQRLAPAYAWVAAERGAPRSAPGPIDLTIRKERLTVNGREGTATSINGSVPGPLVRLREGEPALLRVTNELEEDSSIHWHGLLVPADMDGVPGVSFPGIRPGETFSYRFTVAQSGTYWYHSHSGLQEQSGVYGPLVVDPAEEEQVAYDREYVLLFSDWTYEDPHEVLAHLKRRPGYYNFQRRTVVDLVRDARKAGWRDALSDRLAWGRMRMDPTDLSDVTGSSYTYLLNGLPPGGNWTALFQPGERVRLRLINGSAMTYFDVRIPGLAMTVVQADGQNVEPVAVDELRIAVAETYDVIVEPRGEEAYTVFAEAMDRTGHARGTLATRPGLAAAVPAPRPRPLRTMADMGMAGHGAPAAQGAAGHGAASSDGMPEMEIPQSDAHGAPEKPQENERVAPEFGPGNSMIAEAPRSRLGEPGIGLGEDGRRVLVYTDLRALVPNYEHQHEPDRSLELHLTGNMERYMWSFDGRSFSEVTDDIPFVYGERLRVTLVNDTMMEHPIHLHGMWMVLDNGAGPYRPRKHTINVKPGEKLSFEVNADAPGRWAFHCHLLYHMEMGMFRVVSVSRRVAEASR